MKIDEDSVLWIDSDMIRVPNNLLHRMIDSGKDVIITTTRTGPNGHFIDFNAWVGEHIKPKGDEQAVIEQGGIFIPRPLSVKYTHQLEEEFGQLDFVGGTVLFVREVHQRYQMQEDKSLGALGVFASLAGLVIFIFFIYNIYLIATGVTTNESFKWEDIGEMIYRRELVEVQDISPEGRPVGPKKYEQRDRRHPSHPRYIPPAQPSPAPAPKQDTGYMTQEHVITKMREIDNIYDMGVKANIASILFPPVLTVSDKGRRSVQQSQQPSQEKAKSKKNKKA
ncbi:hypothetical protein BG006_008319 [Podila minutissima]|uniref:Uncharacterized protein n=1 Tax=Podila minutissima TaxID=64525 RepID=A0A9P5SGM4_9FUNG|nr:hypothetical protein BG006_008319 [Podila minutissima]